MNLKKLAAAAAIAVGSIGAAHAIPVALELSLLIDTSGSVDSTEYGLQRDGYVQAFQSAAIQNAIVARGGIAVNYVQWSGAAEQVQLVGWTLINDAASANAFAAAIAAQTSGFGGLTAPGSAINFAAPLFNNNGFEGDRLVIDVSGDGEENDGADTATARNNALLGGVNAINGLAIGGVALETWYNANIKGGANSFVIRADSFSDFAGAVTDKIGREINPTPEPGTLALVGLAIAGLGFGARRRKA